MSKPTAITVAALLLLLAVLASQYSANLHRQAWSIERQKWSGAFDNDPASPIAGNPQGDAVLVIFNDYHNCPHCRLADLNYQKAIRDDPNLKLVYKQLPVLGPDSEFAAVAALASRKQGKYDEFHRALMAFPSRINERITLMIAARVGLDVEQLKRDMQDPAMADEFARTRALAKGLHILGTPALVVGDKVIADWSTWPACNACSPMRAQSALALVRGSICRSATLLLPERAVCGSWLCCCSSASCCGHPAAVGANNNPERRA
ncbi:DsbA family protein [Mesorhizobium sp. ISC15]|uniref:DsbA family protein n=1 Tax=Mesorhizobium sp. ISC15 TaxID=3076429 RepID=UPI00301DAA35